MSLAMSLYDCRSAIAYLELGYVCFQGCQLCFCQSATVIISPAPCFLLGTLCFWSAQQVSRQLTVSSLAVINGTPNTQMQDGCLTACCLFYGLLQHHKSAEAAMRRADEGSHGRAAQH